MKNNQVRIDPNNVEGSLRQLERLYRLEAQALELIGRVIRRYPRPILVYVDEARAQFMEPSPLDDLFTFDTETDELVLYSADTHTFINAMIEMWMYIAGFQTMMGEEDYWKVEFAIGAWKPIRDRLKLELGIPVSNEIIGTIGLPPEPDETSVDDPYPFRSLVSSFNLVAFVQMVRLAGRDDIRVLFPTGTHPKVIEVYDNMRKAIKQVAWGLGIQDVSEFNRRLIQTINALQERYHPETLPYPQGWSFVAEEGEEQDFIPTEEPETEEKRLLLPPPRDEVEKHPARSVASQREVDKRLASGPFGSFIESLFED